MNLAPIHSIPRHHESLHYSIYKEGWFEPNLCQYQVTGLFPAEFIDSIVGISKNIWSRLAKGQSSMGIFDVETHASKHVVIQTKGPCFIPVAIGATTKLRMTGLSKHRKNNIQVVAPNF